MAEELTTPIKIEIPGIGTIESADLYLKSEADKVIAELNETANDLSNGLAEAYDEIRMLRRALWLARAEWARSSALSYHLIESHPDKDAAATYKRKANKWEKVKDKCLKKAEEYK